MSKGSSPDSSCFRPVERILKRSEFTRVHQRGARIPGRYMTALFLENGLRLNRLGIAASRRLGGAVRRNRAKRLIREVFRLNKQQPSGWDVVIIPRTDLLDAPFSSIEADFRHVWQRHAKRARS